MASPENTQERLKAALADRYRIEHEIGSGGMATVYLAEDLKHDRQVAVKVLDPDLAQTLGAERFLREIKTAANLTHPHILPVHDSGEADGFLFYVMPYVRGGSLRARLEEEQQLPVEEAVSIASEIADALAHAHERDVVHRDVKPANILLSGAHALLADFGVAQAVAEGDQTRLTRTGISLGTPAYMSPEQASGEQDLDGRSDQYALGCVLYEMLAGQPPFTGAQVESVVRQHLTAEPPEVTQLRPTVPQGVAEALAKSLAKAPADRFQTTGEFGARLGAELHTPAGGVAAAPNPGRRRGWLMKLVAALGAAAVLLMAWQAWIGDGEVVVTTGPPPWTILAEVDGSAPEAIRRTVRSLISGAIDGSGVVRTLPDGQIRLGFGQALLPETTPVTVAVAHELAARGNIETVFSPVLDQVGSAFALQVSVLGAGGDSVLATDQVSVPTEEELIAGVEEVLETLTDAIADRVGFGVKPRTGVITPSFEAFQRWEEGLRLYYGGRNLEAIRAFKEAIRLDPDFAVAWSRMGIAYYMAGSQDSARWAVDEALARPERLAGYELLFAQYLDEFIKPGDVAERLHQISARMVEEYPDRRSYTNLGLAFVNLGRWDEAVEVMRELEDNSPFGLAEEMNFIGWLTGIGEFEEARQRTLGVREEIRRNRTEMNIAASSAAWDQAEERAQAFLRDPGTAMRLKTRSWSSLALAHAARGRIAEATGALTRALEWEGDQQVRLQNLQRLLTLWVVAGSGIGDVVLPVPTSEDSLTIRELSGLLSLYRGEVEEAWQVAATLPRPDPDDPSLVPGVDAGRLLLFSGLAAAEGNWEAALGFLTSQIGPVGWRGWWSYRQLVEWVVADAYEKLGMPDSAAVHFDRLADPVGDPSFWGYVGLRGLTHSFAHRRAALLCGQLGNREKAIEHWRVFLNDFTDPDPEYEWMVEEARAELARLEG
jgi:serine/threonine-protein kinase